MRVSPDEPSPEARFARLWLGAGAVVLIVGTILLIRQLRFDAQARHVEGRVAELVGEEIDSSILYTPRVEYIVDGQKFEVRSDVSSSTPEHAVGDRIAISYLPGHPERGQMRDPNRFLLPAVFFIAAASMMAGDVVRLVRARRRSFAPP